MPHSRPMTDTRRIRLSAIGHVALAVAILYFARDVVIPIALAMLLMFLLGPIVTRLQRLVRSRALAVALVMSVLILGVGALGVVVGQQALMLTGSMQSYHDTIVRKVKTVREGMRGAVSDAAQTIDKIGHELKEKPKTSSAASQPATTNAAPIPFVAPPPEPVPATAPASVAETTIVEQDPIAVAAAILRPAISPLATTLVVILLLVMMLASPENVRDPIIRLAGLQQISLTTQSLEEAGARVSAYLRTQFLINLIYGSAIGVGMLVLGVPGAAPCGIIAGLLRFVPYVGAWLGAAPPVALAVAAFDGWTQVGLVIVLIGVLEIFNSFILEPWLYGSRTGISKLGVVVAIVFWTWIWGPIGLVLAMPMTVCLLVFARQIPQLAVLPILLGDQPTLSESAKFFQRLLVNNEDEAAAILRSSKTPADPVERLDDIVVPALGSLRLDLFNGVVSDIQAARIAQSVHDVVLDWLADQPAHEPESAAAAIKSRTMLCLPLVDDSDQCAADILAACLERNGLAASTASSTQLLNDMLSSAQEQVVPAVFISAIAPCSNVHIRRVCKGVRRRLPAAKIVVCTWNAPAPAEGQNAMFGGDAEVRDFRRAMKAAHEFAALGLRNS